MPRVTVRFAARRGLASLNGRLTIQWCGFVWQLVGTVGAPELHLTRHHPQAQTASDAPGPAAARPGVVEDAGLLSTSSQPMLPPAAVCGHWAHLCITARHGARPPRAFTMSYFFASMEWPL